MNDDYDIIRASIPIDIQGVYQEDRQKIAVQILEIAQSYCLSVTGKNRKNRAKIKRELRRHIKDNLSINPSEFVIPTVLINGIISGIIGWVIRQLLEKIFNDD